MVTSTIVSKHEGALPSDSGNWKGRKIPDGPLYTTGDVLEVLNLGDNAIRTWTKKCSRDVQNLSLDADDLCELVRIALHSGQFKGSEWCEQKPFGPWAACDAYSLTRNEWVPAMRREMTFEYYIKFAIAKSGNLLLMASCHLQEDRY